MPRLPLTRALLLLGLAACNGGSDPDTATDTGTVSPHPGSERIASYLDVNEASHLVLEVDDGAGVAAPVGVWDDLAAAFGPLTGKPDVQVRSSTIQTDDDVWTAAALEALATTTADEEADDEVHLHLLLLPGRYDADGVVLGRAWGNHHMALFVDAIEDACAAAAEDGWSPGRTERLCAATWKAVVSHEFGHVLGLVNQGLPMVSPHEDPEHPGHEADADCLMYWAFDGPGVASHLAQRANDSGDDVEDLGFCPASLADIDAFR